MWTTKITTKAFTLVEMLLTISLISIISIVSVPTYLSFQYKNDLDNSVSIVARSVKLAQQYARAVESDTTWGVRIQTGQLTVFKGASYAARDTTRDRVYDLSSSVTLSAQQEIVFEKFTGNLSTTYAFSLTSKGNDVRSISINTKGVINY